MMYLTNSTVSRMPTKGAKRMSMLPPPVAKWAPPMSMTNLPDRWTTVFSNTAASPLSTPTTTLSINR